MKGEEEEEEEEEDRGGRKELTFKEDFGLFISLGEAIQDEALVLAWLGSQGLSEELQNVLLAVPTWRGASGTAHTVDVESVAGVQAAWGMAVCRHWNTAESGT